MKGVGGGGTVLDKGKIAYRRVLGKEKCNIFSF